MIRSLTIKLAMLAGTLGFIVALNWLGTTRGVETTLSAEEHFTSPTQAVASTSGRQIKNTEHNTTSSVELRETADSKVGYPNTPMIDLNLSTAQELEVLPGIGPVLAQRIVEYRNQVGSFQSIEDLDEVKGIGTKKLQVLRPLLKVSSSASAGTHSS